MRPRRAQKKAADRKIAVLRLKAARRKAVTKETIVSEAKNHTLYHLIEAEVKELWGQMKECLEEGLTLGGIWNLLEDTASKLVKILERVEAEQQEKKEFVILLVEELYKEEIKDLDLPWVPNSIEGFVDDTIGKAIRPTLSWMIDKIVSE